MCVRVCACVSVLREVVHSQAVGLRPSRTPGVPSNSPIHCKVFQAGCHKEEARILPLLKPTGNLSGENPIAVRILKSSLL